MANPPDEPARLGGTRFEGRAVLAAFEHGLSAVEPQAGILFGRPMTAVAVPGQQGPDLRLETEDLMGLSRRRTGEADEDRDHEQETNTREHRGHVRNCP